MKKFTLILCMLFLAVLFTGCPSGTTTQTPPGDPSTPCDDVFAGLDKFAPAIITKVNGGQVEANFLVKYPAPGVFWGTKIDGGVLVVGIAENQTSLEGLQYQDIQALAPAGTCFPGNVYYNRITTQSSGTFMEVDVNVYQVGNPKGKGTLVSARPIEAVLIPAPVHDDDSTPSSTPE